tara:strand:- start:108 stop:815 length:708 start_codon:yes stop_codon:yes gene_type:complete
MGFMDDIKEDQKMQIQALCVVFFLLAFPSYFFIKAAATDDPAGMGGVGTYTVTGDFSYIDFDSGEETIADGTPFVLDLNTDALSSEDQGKNIVGVLVSMSYDEDEEGAGGLQCNGPNSPQNAPDTISGTATHLEFTNTGDGQNQGGSGSHDVTTEWYNSSIIGTEVEGLSESEIADQLDSNGAGLGDYSVEISVSSNQGSSFGCQNSDSGETVSYTVQLIVLDYEITPYIEIEDI